MFGQGGEAWDPLRPTSNHLHRSGQEVIKLPHMLSVVSLRASWTLLDLVKGHQHRGDRKHISYSSDVRVA